MKSFLLTFLSFVLSCTFLAAQHTVILKTGEKMSGKVQSLSNGVIVFDFKGNSMKLKVDEVSSILFSEGKEPVKATESGSSKLPSEPGEKSITANNTNVKYKVADRTVIKAPVVNNLTQEKGTVVVTVTIDKYGHVRKAVPGAAGSTTKSDYLLTKAKQAAESALFDNVPNAPLEQTGYMVIVF